MIVRILGEGQFDVPEAERPQLKALEEVLDAAIDGDDEQAFGAALDAVIAQVRRVGTQLPADTFTASDRVLPFDDATLAETKELLAQPGGDAR
jgi:hypothetical protein